MFCKIIPILNKKHKTSGKTPESNRKVVVGKIQMIIGIKYNCIYPTPIHTMYNGLTLFQSKLKPAAPNQLACIGGPVTVLEKLCNIAGENSVFSYISCLVNNLDNYKFKVDSFPNDAPLIIDRDMPGADDFFDNYDSQSSGEDEVTDDDINPKENLEEESPDQCLHTDTGHHCAHVKSKLSEYMKMQDAGLGTDYKCPECRNCRECLNGPGREKLSIQQENEQEVIRQSVRIDKDSGRAVARIAFIEDPNLNLKPNMHIVKRGWKIVVKSISSRKKSNR